MMREGIHAMNPISTADKFAHDDLEYEHLNSAAKIGLPTEESWWTK
jgi:hypothetical protein